MKLLKNLRLKNKLLIIITPLLLTLIFISSSRIDDLNQLSKQMEKTSQLARLSTYNSALVHELQKERGLTAGYLGSNGENFSRQLAEQQKTVDSTRAYRSEYLSSLSGEIDNAIIITQIDKITNDFRRLATIRRRVSQLDINAPEAISYYTNLNGHLLAVATSIANLSGNAAISQEIISYDNFLQGKERAGIERAVLANAFASKQFSNDGFEKFIRLVSEQNTYFGNFTKQASAETKSMYSAAMRAPVIKEIALYRDDAKSEKFQSDANDWFDAATQRINILKTIEDELSTALIDNSLSLLNKANNTLVFTCIIIALGIVSSLVLSSYILKIITDQISALQITMRQAQSANDLTIRAKIICQDEVGDIAKDLNLMLEKFSAVIDDIRKSSMQLAAASEETTTTISHNAGELQKQQQETDQLATAIHEMSATAQEMSNNTQLASDAINDASHQVDAGNSLVILAVNSIESLARDIQHAGDIIGNLHDSSSAITGVLDVIKSVADQTNLLALNAAIEAARAGEQGRGFAVVADEVRSLAQRTQESAGEIERIITSFQGDTSTANTAITGSKEKTSESVNNARSIQGMLSNISTAITTTQNMSSLLASASKEQVEVSAEVSVNVTRISDISRQNAVGSSQIAITANDQARLASNLQSLADSFSV